MRILRNSLLVASLTASAILGSPYVLAAWLLVRYEPKEVLVPLRITTPMPAGLLQEGGYSVHYKTVQPVMHERCDCEDHDELEEELRALPARIAPPTREYLGPYFSYDISKRG